MVPLYGIKINIYEQYNNKQIPIIEKIPSTNNTEMSVILNRIIKHMRIEMSAVAIDLFNELIHEGQLTKSVENLLEKKKYRKKYGTNLRKAVYTINKNVLPEIKDLIEKNI